MTSTNRELSERLRVNPDDPAAYERLKAYRVASGNLLAAADLIEAWGARRRDAVEASQAYVEASQLLTECAGQEPRVVSLLELALTLHPPHVLAADLLHRHFSSRGDAEGWTESLARRRDQLARAHRPNAEIAKLEHELGHAWLQRRSDDRAARHFRAAFELDPGRVDALQAARAIHLERGEVRQAVLTLLLEAEAQPDPATKTALLLEAKGRFENELGDVEGAIEATRAILALGTGSELEAEERRWLVEAHIARGEAADAAALLEPAVRAGDEAAARTVVELSDARPGVPLDLRLAALETLARIYGESGRHGAAAAALERLVDADLAPQRAAELARELARITLDELGDVPRATRALERWAEIAPGDPEPARRLEAIRAGAGDASEDVLDVDALVEEFDQDAGDEAVGPDEVEEVDAYAVEEAGDDGGGAVEDVDDALVEALEENERAS